MYLYIFTWQTWQEEKDKTITGRGPIYLLNVEEYERREEERANDDTTVRGRTEAWWDLG